MKTSFVVRYCNYEWNFHSYFQTHSKNVTWAARTRWMCGAHRRAMQDDQGFIQIYSALLIFIWYIQASQRVRERRPNGESRFTVVACIFCLYFLLLLHSNAMQVMSGRYCLMHIVNVVAEDALLKEWSLLFFLIVCGVFFSFFFFNPTNFFQSHQLIKP